MPTLQKQTTDIFTPWTEVPSDSVVFLQNRGSTKAELWVGSSTPTPTTIGVLLVPGTEGIQLILEAADSLYIRDTDLDAYTIIVAVV